MKKSVVLGGLFASHSEQLAHGVVRENVRKDTGSVSTGADLSTVSSSAGPSRSLKLDNWEDYYASAQLVSKEINNPVYDCVPKQNDNWHNQSISGFTNGNVRKNYKDPVHLGYHGTSGINIHYSRPLPLPQVKPEQMLTN